MGFDLPQSQKKWNIDCILDMLSLLQLPYCHELLGHYALALLFDVAVVDTFWVPQIRGNRIGIGISVDWRTASSPVVMVLVLFS